MPKTIEEFLWSVDPNIGYRRTSEKVSHTHVKIPKWPRIVQKWKDFDLKTLRKMSNGDLKKSLEMPFDHFSCPQHGAHVREQYKKPNKEGALDGFLISSVQRTVNCALLQTQQELHSRKLLLHVPRPGIEMLTGKQAEPLGAREDSKSYEPDWAGCLPVKASKDYFQFGEAKPQTALPGDTKLRWKVDWNVLNDELAKHDTLDFLRFGAKNKEVPPAEPEEDAGFLPEYHGLRQAIVQIYTYCYDSGCRYGYVINETQLLVVRIRPNTDREVAHEDQDAIFEALKEDGLLEYRLIGYNATDRTRLSVNLALWWLHLLAAHDNKIQWRYAPLKRMTLGAEDASDMRSSRAVSVESAALPDSQMIEDQDFDLRVPLRNLRPKRKQESTHRSGQRGTPARPQTPSKMLTDRQVKDEPESDLKMIPYPTPSPDRQEPLKPSTQTVQAKSRKEQTQKAREGKQYGRKQSTKKNRMPKSTKPQVFVKTPKKPISPARPPLAVLQGYVKPADKPKEKIVRPATSAESPGPKAPIPGTPFELLSEQTSSFERSSKPNPKIKSQPAADKGEGSSQRRRPVPPKAAIAASLLIRSDENCCLH